MIFKMPFYLQNKITIGKFDQDFTDLEEILNFLPRKNNFTNTKYNQEGCKSGNYLPITSATLHALKRVGKPQSGGQEQGPPGSEKKVLLEHSHWPKELYSCLTFCYDNKGE